MTIDELLRDAVHGLAHEARTPADLATGAMVRGRRIRRRRRSGLTAAVVAVALLAMTAIPYAVRHERPAPAVEMRIGQQVRWWEAPVALPGGWIVTGFGRNSGGLDDAGSPARAPKDAMVLDRHAGRYRSIPHVRLLWPAPSGRIVAFSADDNAHYNQVGLLDLDTGRTEWIQQESLQAPQWSPDGRRLLFTTGEGFVVLEVSTRRATPHAVDSATYPCSAECLFTWQPDGEQVGRPVDDPGGPEPPEGAPDVPARKGVQLFAADTGQPTKLLPTRGDPRGTEAWSPGGRYVLLGERDRGARQLVEVTSGKVVRTFPESSWDGVSLYFTDDDHLLAIRGDGASSIAIDTGRVVAEVSLPAEAGIRAIGAGAN